MYERLIFPMPTMQRKTALPLRAPQGAAKGALRHIKKREWMDVRSLDTLPLRAPPSLVMCECPWHRLHLHPRRFRSEPDLDGHTIVSGS